MDERDPHNPIRPRSLARVSDRESKKQTQSNIHSGFVGQSNLGYIFWDWMFGRRTDRQHLVFE